MRGGVLLRGVNPLSWPISDWPASTNQKVILERWCCSDRRTDRAPAAGRCRGPAGVRRTGDDSRPRSAKRYADAAPQPPIAPQLPLPERR